MGVPGFFSWIMGHTKRKLIKTPSKPCCLYIDANCLIHPQCFKILKLEKEIKDNMKLEELMIERIIKYLTYLEGVVNPSSYVYIAIDGVAPMAKVTQQRKRRFKTAQDASYIDYIKIKHGVKPEPKWTNTAISPGTEFMEKLHEKINEHYTNKEKHITYVYSSYHTNGEGEHKILQDIKNCDVDGDIVVYGLDADLIFLSLASQKQNIYLLRESNQFKRNNQDDDDDDSIEQELTFISIDNVKKAFNDILQLELDEDVSNDFIFLCFFLGNDFLPHLPTIDIHHEGIEQLIDSYFYAFEKIDKRLIQNNKINDEFLLTMLEHLSQKENTYLTEILPKYGRKRKCYVTEPLEIELWNMENKIKDDDDIICLGRGEEKEWKGRYYNYYKYNENINVRDMVNKYLEGIAWVTQYYFNKCDDWIWMYQYNVAPFISDIIKFYEPISSFTFKTIRNVQIIIQLLIIVPPQYYFLLPKVYKNLVYDSDSPIIEMYPVKTKYNTLHKTQHWQCEPLLPPVDIKKIFTTVRKLFGKLTNEEKKRNKRLEIFIYQ